MVMSRGSCRAEITLQNPALLQFCFFDLSHSFLNMQQCKYIYINIAGSNTTVKVDKVLLPQQMPK